MIGYDMEQGRIACNSVYEDLKTFIIQHTDDDSARARVITQLHLLHQNYLVLADHIEESES